VDADAPVEPVATRAYAPGLTVDGIFTEGLLSSFRVIVSLAAKFEPFTVTELPRWQLPELVVIPGALGPYGHVPPSLPSSSVRWPPSSSQQLPLEPPSLPSLLDVPWFLPFDWQQSLLFELLRLSSFDWQQSLLFELLRLSSLDWQQLSLE
jgi:hypothetical protein